MQQQPLSTRRQYRSTEKSHTVREDRLDLGPVPLAQLDDGTGCEGGEHGAGQLEAVMAIRRGGASDEGQMAKAQSSLEPNKDTEMLGISCVAAWTIANLLGAGIWGRVMPPSAGTSTSTDGQSFLHYTVAQCKLALIPGNC